VERDYALLRELDRWRWALSRHIRYLGEFSGQRTCDRRLKLLIEAGYIDRKHVLYGIPALYFVTHKGKVLEGLSLKADKFKVEQITHDIAVLDTVIYFLLKHQVPLAAITTEKQLHQRDGFGIRKHRPDFVFLLDGKNHCVEVELTPKAKTRMGKILQDNFMAYDYQNWIVPHTQIKIRQMLSDNAAVCPNIAVLDLAEVVDFVKQYGQRGEGWDVVR